MRGVYGCPDGWVYAFTTQLRFQQPTPAAPHVHLLLARSDVRYLPNENRGSYVRNNNQPVTHSPHTACSSSLASDIKLKKSPQSFSTDTHYACASTHVRRCRERHGNPNMAPQSRLGRSNTNNTNGNRTGLGAVRTSWAVVLCSCLKCCNSDKLCRSCSMAPRWSASSNDAWS